MDGNTCADSLGAIIKVEIRGYCSEEDVYGQMTLTPVFTAGDGDAHNHDWPGVISGGGWSDWFDITTDTNAPSPWTWTAVQSLGCKATTVGDGTDYCYKVEIRVTYSITS